VEIVKFKGLGVETWGGWPVGCQPFEKNGGPEKLGLGMVGTGDLNRVQRVRDKLKQKNTPTVFRPVFVKTGGTKSPGHDSQPDHEVDRSPKGNSSVGCRISFNSSVNRENFQTGESPEQTQGIVHLCRDRKKWRSSQRKRGFRNAYQVEPHTVDG